MPKPLFFSIAQAKQDRIISSALKEFSTHEYHEASINRIVQKAGIARGSFYQYFEDKEDIFFYLFEQIIQNEHLAFFRKKYKELPDDPILFHQMMFRFNLSMLENERYQGFFRNLFLSMNYRFGGRYRKIVEKSRLVVISQMGQKDEEKTARINNTLEVLTLITLDLLALKALENVPDDVIWQKYHTKMELLGLEQ